jgi:mRNA interferase YafQ
LSSPTLFEVTSNARKGAAPHDLDSLVSKLVSLLSDDVSLPDNLRDHGLSGDWQVHRECQLKSDLLLIYRKPSADVLPLIRMGSHSERFG